MEGAQVRPDCVVIGHNDSDFDAFANRLKQQEKRNGGYSDVRTNSVLLEGRRVDFMELLGHAVAAANGGIPALNVFADPQASVCYLASFLAKRGFAVETVNAFRLERERLKEILARNPRTVAVTTTFYVDHDPLIEVVKFVREHAPNTKIIVGGPHIYNICEDMPADAQDYLFTMIGADIYVHDMQGESTLASTVRSQRGGLALSLSAVPNLIVRNGTSWHRTERKPESNVLDENVIDWSLFGGTLKGASISLRTARSCPFECSFCNYPTQAGAHVVASVETVEKELRALHEAGVRHLRFIDDTFNVPLPRFKALMRMMRDNKFEFQWMSFFRCSNADDETFPLMREAGCVGVLLGIESGDASVLKIMNKHAKPERYEYGIGKLHANDILSYASMIVGFPGETDETVQNTIDFIERTQPTFFGPLLYYHDTRAPIAARKDEFQIKGAGYSWSHATMDWRRAAKWVERMQREIKNSVPLTLHGFCMFAQPYLLSKGISNRQLIEFGKRARPLLLRSPLEQNVTRSDPEFQELVSVFSAA
jgi:radical SAM PhpK family P-methyltransferase